MLISLECNGFNLFATRFEKKILYGINKLVQLFYFQVYV